MNTALFVMRKVGKQIAKQAPKYSAKFVLGVPVEVGTFFLSQAIINKIQEKKSEKEIEVIG